MSPLHVRRNPWWRVLPLLAIMSLAACGRSVPATPTPSATVTSVPPTSTPAETLAPRPTPTPPATPTGTPTLAPTPTPILRTPIPTLAVAPTRVLSADEHQAVFDEVWSLVQRFYYDAKFNGVDWLAVKEAYAPRIGAAGDTGAVYRLLWEMVEELRDDHTHFRPPDRVAFDTLFSGEFDGLYGGAQFAPLPEGDLLVWRVLEGSWEDAAGLKRGDVVVALNGDGEDLAYRLRDGFAPSPGETVTYTLALPDGSARLLPIAYHHLRLRWQVSARRLAASDIGYVEIPSFTGDDTGDAIRQAVDRLWQEGPLEGLILDLRSNHGGSNAAANRAIQLFLSRNEKEYRCYQYRGSPPDPCPDPGEVRRPQAPWPDLPLVVLVNGTSESNGEMVPAILQHFGRAMVVGEPTQGNTELVWLYPIAADSSNLQLAVALSLLPDGGSIEGVGLTPDVVAPMGRWDLAQGRDPGLAAAIALLQQGSS